MLKKTLIAALLLMTASLQAQTDEFALCQPLTEWMPPRPQLPPPEGDSVQLFADQAFIDEHQGVSTFTGDVLLQRADQILGAHVVVYDRNQDVIDADNEFTFWDKNVVLRGQSIQLNAQDQGEMKQVDYWLLSRRAWGHANKVIKKSDDIFGLEKASYTTCDPEHQVWQLDARRTLLNNQTATGSASNVVIRLLGVPIFYTPYLSFPLNDARKSGFLFPSVGSSDETGTEISVPYYLNLAPHYDATLTPRIMSRRGALLTTEVRYLTQQAGGQLEFEYMPHDKAFGDERASLAYVHRGPLSEHWYTDININYASDERYFEELGNNISVASVTHLERRGDLLYIGNGWNLLTRVQEFQTLTTNPNAKPYERMPQLLFKTQLPERNQALNFDLQTEFVRFDRDSEVIGNPIGQRVDMYTLFSYPWKTPATFVIPKLSLRYTLYELEQRATGENSNPDRFLYTFSTDSGLFLERSIKNEQFIQTLEPRLFYRYTPYDDQSELPVFDTALYDLSFWQLFRPNRYSGPDRIDDGHQVTLALTSRFLDAQTGIERLRASLGQIYYFRDRRVTLPYQEPETESSSPIIVELASQLTEHWSSAATWRWDPHQQNTEHTVLRTRYHPSQNNIVNFSYRLRDNILEQTDLSTHWSLGARWNVLARWNYSLPQERTLETFTGLEYSSCCWAIRGIVRRYLNNIDGFSYLNGFFLQFELKGLGGIGKKADSFLEQRIPGYHDQF